MTDQTKHTNRFHPATEIAAHELSRMIHARELSCREVMQAFLGRIHALNPTYNALVSLQDESDLLRQADARDAQLARGESMGWMHGMPQALKDLANVAGMPTTQGSPLLRQLVAREDGLVASRMRASGCIFVGKTNTPEFGLGSHTFNEVFGVTRNAWDTSRSAGGSSGGAAVALATRMLPVADGSDFMGSLRNPAAWNHVFGLRPSQGRVPYFPAADVFVSQLPTEGPMGRSVMDVAQLLQIQAGHDPRVPLSIAGRENFTDELDAFESRRARIGWLGDLNGYLPMEPGILATCEQGLQRLQGLGCTVEPAALGYPPEKVWQAWLVWRRWLVAARIAPYIANPAQRAQVKPEALWEFDQAQGLSGPDTLTASIQRSAFFEHMVTLFEKYDYLALPCSQVWPFDASERWPKSINGQPMDTYHRWMEVVIYATFAGLPCISLPAGFGANGLPMGLQIIGRPQCDLAVLQLARAYEQAAQSLLAQQPPMG
jgi:amidase